MIIYVQIILSVLEREGKYGKCVLNWFLRFEDHEIYIAQFKKVTMNSIDKKIPEQNQINSWDIDEFLLVSLEKYVFIFSDKMQYFL